MTTQQIIKYLNDQFPATVGHIPIEAMLDALKADASHAGWLRGQKDAAECVKQQEAILIPQEYFRERAATAILALTDTEGEE